MSKYCHLGGGGGGGLRVDAGTGSIGVGRERACVYSSSSEEEGEDVRDDSSEESKGLFLR
jgi:hypothetical protein